MAAVDRVLPWRRHQNAAAEELTPLLTAYRRRHPKASVSLINRAYETAREAHRQAVRDAVVPGGLREVHRVVGRSGVNVARRDQPLLRELAFVPTSAGDPRALGQRRGLLRFRSNCELLVTQPCKAFRACGPSSATFNGAYCVGRANA